MFHVKMSKISDMTNISNSQYIGQSNFILDQDLLDQDLLDQDLLDQ